MSDFNEDAGTLFVAESKTGNPRTVYLGAEAVRFFAMLCTDKCPNDPILAKSGTSRWSKDDAKGLMEAACTAAEIEPCTIHELRHTAASRWIQQGLSLPEVADQLGHNDLRMVSRHYGHLSKATLGKRMRAMKPMGIFHTKGTKGEISAGAATGTIQ